MERLQHTENAGNRSTLLAGRQGREKPAGATLPLLKSVRNGSRIALECFLGGSIVYQTRLGMPARITQRRTVMVT